LFFRSKDVEFVEIGKKLNVGHILEGSVRKAGSRIRVTAQLIKAADGFHLWSERYDREMTDVFAIQDEISQAIAEKLRIQLAGDRPLVKRHTENVEAYSLYLKGRHQFYKATEESTAKCKEYYEQAIAADPNYAMAWYGLAKYYWWIGYAGFLPPKTANIKCREAAIRTLELDEKLAEAHAVLGSVYALEFDWKGAEREFRFALELDPKSQEVSNDYAFFYLLAMQRIDEAIFVLQKSLELDPLSLIVQNLLGEFKYFIGQYDQAIQHWRNCLDLSPQSYAFYSLIGSCYLQKGLMDEGIRECEKALQLSSHWPLLQAIAAAAYAQAGRIGEAQIILEQLEANAPERYVPPSCFARIYFALGEVDKCLDWLEKTVEEQDAWILFINTDKSWSAIHSHPRYHALLRKMNLEA